MNNMNAACELRGRMRALLRRSRLLELAGRPALARLARELAFRICRVLVAASRTNVGSRSAA